MANAYITSLKNKMVIKFKCNMCNELHEVLMDYNCKRCSAIMIKAVDSNSKAIPGENISQEWYDRHKNRTK